MSDIKSEIHEPFTLFTVGGKFFLILFLSMFHLSLCHIGEIFHSSLVHKKTED
jgi:hypothetical protein